MPVNNFKKNNNNNKQNNKPQLEETPVEIQEQVPTPEIQVENPSTVAVQEAEKTEKKPRRTRKTRFDKPKTEPVETPLAVTEEVHTAETVLKINEEIKPEIAEEVIEAKFTKQEPVEKTEVSAEPAKEEAPAPEKAAAKQNSEKAAAKQNSEKAETNDEKPAEPVETEVKEEKPKRTRRPNRGTSKRTRTKKTASEEKVETEES